MRTAALLALAFGLTFVPALSAQEPELPVGVPAELADRIRADVATRWTVAPHQVVLDMGVPRGGEPLSADATYELVGSGAGGHWVLRASTTAATVVSLRLRAGVWETAAVAGRRIERGESLLSTDVVSAQSIRWGEPRHSEASPEEGWIAQRLIREGEPLSRPAVQPPLAVRSGEAVQLLWAQDGVGVRAPARAAGSAMVGQQIYVRTVTGVRLKGVVVAPGLVNVTQGGSQ